MSSERHPGPQEQHGEASLTVDGLPNDSEFLELLDADVALSHLLQPSPTSAARADTDAFAFRDNGDAAGLVRAPPRSFLIGGSLFTPRCTAATGPWGHLGCLSVCPPGTSIFCPFTHQYVSLLSLHWTQLYAAGFGLSSGRGGACRVMVRSVLTLHSRAKSLQGGGDGNQTKGTALLGGPLTQRSDPSHSLSLSDPTRSRQDSLYASWGWSKSLQQTLGELLCTAPLARPAELLAHVAQALHTRDNYRDARAIQSAGSLTPWRTRWADLQWPQRLMEQHSSATVKERGKAMAVRWSDVHSPPPTLAEAEAQADSPLPEWSKQFSTRRPFPLLGMPSHIRAAFLEVPFFFDQRDAPLMMPSVCAAVLRRLAGDLTASVVDGGQAHNAEAAAAPRLYYCPLAHGVDYSGVLDLTAFRVSLSADSFSPPELCENGAAAPVLSLGMECADEGIGGRDEAEEDETSPLRVVVFDNAHFLSKRAISRLLDQWTRNGAAVERQQQQQRRRAATTPEGHAEADRASSRRWQTLMGTSAALDTVLPHLRTLATPFGSVQAIFLSYRAASVDNKAHDAPAHGAEEPMATLRVASRPSSDVLYVEEPLSAALLRVSTLCRRHLTATQRRDLLDSVVQRVMFTASTDGTELMFAKHKRQLLPSGKPFVDKLEVPLHSPKGQTLLYEACEALVSLLSPLDAFLHGRQGQGEEADRTVEVLTSYPMLSTLRVRHMLVSTYALQVSLPPAEAGQSGDGGTRPPHRTSPRVSFLADRQSGHAREAQDRSWCVLQQRICAASGHARATSSIRSTGAATAVAAGAAALRPLLVQTYSLYAEPPLLLGRWWTATLLFCAPTLADVVTLRLALLRRLRRRAASLASLRGREENSEDVCTVRVVDVDIFHCDFASHAAQQRQRCRVFGVRALAHFSNPATDGRNAEEEKKADQRRSHARVMRKLEAYLQLCLKRCAARASFFPLWTYLARANAASPSSHAVSTEDEHLVSAEGGDCEAGAPSPRRRRGDSSLFPDFDRVLEWRTLWVPTVVERRLFTLAVAQRPPAALTIGTRVVLREAVQIPSTDGGDVLFVLPRGSVCEVVGFVELQQLRGVKSTRDSALPGVVRQQVRGWTEAEQRHIDRYVTQQQHASALPLLRRVHDGTFRNKEEDVFVLTPQPFLVGGYRSTHYYGLPVLHLPVFVLSGGGEARGQRQRRHQQHPRNLYRSAPRGKAVVSTSSPPSLPVTSHTVPLDCVLTEVFHPYQSHASGSRSALCLTPAERVEALRLLFARIAPLKAPRSAAAVGGGDGKDMPSPHTPLSFMEDVLFYEADGTESLMPQQRRPLDSSAATPAEAEKEERVIAPVTCALLTELGLYARRFVME